MNEVLQFYGHAGMDDALMVSWSWLHLATLVNLLHGCLGLMAYQSK